MDILYLAAMILLPIVPAFLLFKLLAAAGQVSGKLMGFSIKLGGAFAGYFAVLLLLMFELPVWHPTYSVLQFHGTVTDENGNPIQPLDEKDITLVPDDLMLIPGGEFEVKFTVANNDWPTLSISHPNYKVDNIVLDPNAAGMKDNGKGHYTISNKIILHKLAPYAGTGTPPTPVTDSQEPNHE